MNANKESAPQAIQLILLALGFCLFVRMAILSPPLVHVPVDDIVVQTHLEQAELDSIQSSTEKMVTEATGICSHFPRHFTAASVWKEHLDTIWNASQNPTKPEYSNSTILKDILYHVLSPRRLRQGLRVRPSSNHQIAALSRVIEIIETKLLNPATAPPLKIAVLGGSVTAGRGCWPAYRGLVNRDCAWPRRLEHLLNQALFVGNNGKHEIVKVYNMAVGGTSTAQGNVFVKYWMYPGDMRETGPDIIINSYSTNDSLPPWGQTEGVTETVLKRTLRDLQAFVRYALLSRPCKPPPPLVIHVDDYLGHQNQTSLLGEMAYNTAMVQVANYYQTMAVSYPDTVRDIVYQNTAETTFSANWMNPRSPNNLKIEVHFGFEAHTAISWVVAYGLLEVLSNYCDEQGNDPVAAVVKRQQNKTVEKDWTLAIPPKLDETIRLQDVSQRWQEGPRDEGYDPKLDCSTAASTGNNQNPCVLTMIAAPTGIFNAGALQKFMQHYIIQNDGWGALDDMKTHGWAKKLGWEPQKAGASFTMQLLDIRKNVHVITIMYMKSYGDKWANSTARFTVQDLSSNQTLTKDLLGYHDSKTSISYTERIVLPQSIRKGNTMNLRVDLIGGTTFKISGMMFCSW